MCEEILPVKSLILADKEHFTIDLLKKFNNHRLYDILMPAPMTAKTKKLLSKLSYKRQWAGFAIGETTYTFNNNDQYRLLAQRSGENAGTYSYRAFITTSGKDAIELLSEEYDKRWSIEEFFNFEGAMGFNRASTFNLNIRYGKLSLAMIAQAATYEFRKNGISNPAQRISELIMMGAIIKKNSAPAIDESGKEHKKVSWYLFQGWEDDTGE